MKILKKIEAQVKECLQQKHKNIDNMQCHDEVILAWCTVIVTRRRMVSACVVTPPRYNPASTTAQHSTHHSWTGDRGQHGEWDTVDISSVDSV